MRSISLQRAVQAVVDARSVPSSRLLLQRREVALGQPELARPQQPAHDLAAARLAAGRRRTSISFGATAAPSRRAARSRSARGAARRSARSRAAATTNALTTCAGDRIGLADHAGLGDRRVLHQRALDLERTDEVAGRLDDVVAAARRTRSSRRRRARARSPVQVPAAGEARRGSARPRRGSRGTSTASPAAARARPPRPARRSSTAPSRTTTSPSSSRRRIGGLDAGQRPAHRARAGCRIAAKLAIMIPPVSVCHQLSWIGRPKRLDAPHAPPRG